ncbi:GntR family transcriptional regulator [Roseobacter sp. N2S]|uniref:GntR family transcriptional regulator n=1 Tax=Roseobacter sp. N2S TaxID=2663844 RepID=UPI0028669EFA|nr:GntR family transcriptional regulator [Roseobacter sp. N2S]MDR6265791.1 DNA-binding GntR family transcriptional regulator [Roseobacter sp. N2S]
MSLTQKACDRLKDAIVSGRFEFGERLSEEQIARALGMSKAPVRAAFMDLRDMGLVTIVPQAGTYVFIPSAQDVAEMSSFRAMLESQALRSAFERDSGALAQGLTVAITQMEHAINSGEWAQYSQADSAFHRVILQQAGNRYVEKAYDLTATALEALRARLQSGEGNFWQRSFAEHIKMRDFIAGGNLDAAHDLLQDHILIINRSISLPSASVLQHSKGRRLTDERCMELLSDRA